MLKPCLEVNDVMKSELCKSGFEAQIYKALINEKDPYQVVNEALGLDKNDKLNLS